MKERRTFFATDERDQKPYRTDNNCGRLQERGSAEQNEDELHSRDIGETRHLLYGPALT